ncbi:hypothetical protein [Flavihumibacter sp. ZG627]|uniref:hypothetical protein n=1 Tax=Flavihumibacter sp. ZG627 TaxID=1463156 RepID=UPI00057FFB7E|nr:hypothetical protein [Flavihumibacter sp. ZG627]KIC90817.1 hypothetical protein HY58_07120 [Flavihumibacter sp. ZG627]
MKSKIHPSVGFQRHLQLITLLFISTTTSFAQVQLRFSDEKIEIVRKPDTDIFRVIKVSIQGATKEDSATVSIRNNPDKDSYKLEPFVQVWTPRATEFEFSIPILRGKINKPDTIDLQIVHGDVTIQKLIYIIPNKVDEFEEVGEGINNFRIVLGHSFDFFDKNNRLLNYGRFEVFLPNLISEKQGVHFYVVQTNFNSSSSVNRYGDSINVLDEMPLKFGQQSDSVLYFRNFYGRKAESTYKAFGFGFQGLTRLAGKKNNFTNGTNIYLTSGFEYIRREVDIKYSYQLLSSDTLLRAKNYPSRKQTEIKQLKSVYHEGYGGIGFLVNNHNNVANTRIRYMMGYLFTVGERSSLGNILNAEVGLSHWFNIDVVERLTKLNLNLGIDWRQSYKDGFFYNVYLSKTFSLGSLKNFLVGG